MASIQACYLLQTCKDALFMCALVLYKVFTTARLSKYVN